MGINLKVAVLSMLKIWAFFRKVLEAIVDFEKWFHFTWQNLHIEAINLHGLY